MRRLVGDTELHERLSAGARERAGRLTWSATAIGTLSALAEEAGIRPR